MRICAFRKQKKHIIQVIFDDMTCIELDKDIFESAALKKGDELSDAEADALQRKSDAARCLSRALYYLESRDMSEKELAKKLKTAGFENADITAAVKKLVSLKLLDDARYAGRLKEKLTYEGKSLREIKEKFYLSGIPREISEQLLTRENEAEKIKTLILKKYRDKLETKETTEKLIASLARHGYRFSDIREALGDISEYEFTEE